MSLARWAVALLAGLWLAACGAGDSTRIDIQPESLSFAAAEGDALPPPQMVKASFHGYAVLVGYPPNVPEVPWLNITNGPRDAEGASFQFSITTTSMPMGSQKTTVRFVTGKEDGTDLKYVDMPVTYTVLRPLAASPSQLSFVASSGQTTLPAPKTVTVTGDESQPASFSVTATYQGGGQDWLALPPPGTTPQTVTIGPKTTALAPGLYMATLSFTSNEGKSTARVGVSYSVNAPIFAAAPARLEFTAVGDQGALPAAQTVNVSALAGQTVNYTVTASYTGARRDWLTLPERGATPQQITVRPNTTALPLGQYEAVLTFTPQNDMPAVQVAITYVVAAPKLAVSPSQLTFTGSSGQTELPPAQTVNITGEQDSAVSYTVTASYSGPQRDWLTLPPAASTPQTISLRPNTTSLPLGQYSAVLTFTPNNGQPAVQLPITYSIAVPDLRVNPSAPELRVDASTQEAGLTSQLAITSTGAPLDWRVVSVNASWLDLSLTSGNTQSQPGLNLVVRRGSLSSMDNGSYSSTLKLAYSNASTPERQVDIPVKLTITLPRIRIITPYATEAGRSLSHILRGDGFSGLQSGHPLRFGETTTTSYQVISDSEIRLTVPALPVGAHRVSVDSPLGLSSPGPNLYAVQTPAFPAVSIPRTRGIRRLIYDPRRTAIYTVEYNSNGVNVGLYRYRFANGAWTEDAYVTLPNIYDAVMDVDGQSLYMPIGTGLYRLDLDDATATPQYLRPNWGQYNQLQILNDGTVVDMSSSCTHGTTSLDGRRALMMTQGCSSDRPVWTLDVGGTQWQRSPLNTYGPPSWIALDRTARYAFVENAIYNAQWSLVADATGLHQVIFSNDARRLFALFADYTGNKQLLRVYDVSNPPTGGRFPRLAEYTVAGAQPSDGFYGGGKVITPNDRTLILVDSRQFHVIPIPADVQ